MRSIGGDLDPLALNSSGERLMIVDVLVHDETLFALLGWYAPSPESEEPGTDVLDCRLELVRMSLADGEIAGSLVLADKAVVVTRVLGMGGSLTRMSDGAILVTSTVGQPRFALAVVVDPDSMTARLDATSVVDAPEGSYTLDHLGEGCSAAPSGTSAISPPPGSLSICARASASRPSTVVSCGPGRWELTPRATVSSCAGILRTGPRSAGSPSRAESASRA